jgi:O-antigen/teichoic acid export membrane protein
VTITGLIQKLRGSGHGATMARGASGTFTVNVVGALLALGSHIALARFMGTAHYGAYLIAIACISIFQCIGVMGLDRTLVRFLAVYRSNADWASFRGLLWRSHSIAGATSLVLAGLLALSAVALKAWLDDQLALSLVAGAPVLVLMVLSIIRQASLRSMTHVVVAEIPEVVIRPVLIATLVFFAYKLSAQEVSGATAMKLNVVATVVTLGVGATILFRRLPSQGLRGPRTYKTQEWMAVAFPLAMVTLLNMLMKRTDILFLGAYWGTEEAGPYGAATRMIELIVYVLTAINGIASPLLAAAYFNQKTTELQRILLHSARWLALLTVPMVVGLVLFGKFFLGLFGDEFVSAYIPLIILAVGQLVNALTGSVSAVMSMTGHQRPLAITLAAIVVLNIALNAILVPRFGAIGAASATAFATGLCNVILLMLVSRLLGLNTTLFARNRPQG